MHRTRRPPVLRLAPPLSRVIALWGLLLVLLLPGLGGCPKETASVEAPEAPAAAYIVGLANPQPIPLPAEVPATTATAGASSMEGLLKPDQIEVHVPDAALFSGIEVVCMDGYRQRATIHATADSVSGVVRIGGIQAPQCRLLFKGGTPATFSPVVPGTTYDCKVIGSTAVCKPKTADKAPAEVAPRRAANRKGLVAGDVLVVEVTDAPGTSALELSCPGGYRQRQALASAPGGASASAYAPVSSRYVPKESCTLYFKGITPARFDPAMAGTSLQCHLVSSTAVCTPSDPGR